jgi:hypothetical protein
MGSVLRKLKDKRAHTYDGAKIRKSHFLEMAERRKTIPARTYPYESESPYLAMTERRNAFLAQTYAYESNSPGLEMTERENSVRQRVYAYEPESPDPEIEDDDSRGNCLQCHRDRMAEVLLDRNFINGRIVGICQGCYPEFLQFLESQAIDDDDVYFMSDERYATRSGSFNATLPQSSSPVRRDDSAISILTSPFMPQRKPVPSYSTAQIIHTSPLDNLQSNELVSKAKVAPPDPMPGAWDSFYNENEDGDEHEERDIDDTDIDTEQNTYTYEVDSEESDDSEEDNWWETDSDAEDERINPSGSVTDLQQQFATIESSNNGKTRELYNGLSSNESTPELQFESMPYKSETTGFSPLDYVADEFFYPSIKLQDCSICGESKDGDHYSPPTWECSHDIDCCNACLQLWIASQLESKGWKKITCPDTKCKRVMDANDIQRNAEPETYFK